MDAGLADQGGKAGAGIGFQLLDAGPDHPAILPREGHNVRNGAHRRQIGVPGKHALCVARQRADQLERNAHAGELEAGRRVVWPLRIHHRRGGGKLRLAFVVIGDDHIHAGGGGIGGLRNGGDAAVHRDDERDALAFQMIDRADIQTVALVEPVGDIQRRFQADAAKILGQQAGGGDTVHVVIAVYRGGLAPLQGEPDARYGLIHVLQGIRILQRRGRAVQKGGGLGGGNDAPCSQYGCKQGGITRLREFLGYGGHRGDGPYRVIHILQLILFLLIGTIIRLVFP